MSDRDERILREHVCATWPGDESVEASYDEVFTFLAGLRDRGGLAMIQIRSADNREVAAQVIGIIEAVDWEDEYPLPGRCIDVRGDGWVFALPESQFADAELRVSGLGIDLDVDMGGYRFAAGLRRDPLSARGTI